MGSVYVKRFAVTGVVRDKDYVLTKGTAGSKVLYFTVNPNGESEIIKVSLKPKPRLKKLNFDFDFSELAIKGRSSQGNLLSKNAVKKIVQAEKGFSTLGARHIWYDDTVMRLNTDQRGQYIGAFKEDDRILTLTRSGFYKLTSFDLSNHFEEDMFYLEKFNPSKALTVLYFSEAKNAYFIKRFIPEFSDKKVCMFPEEDGNKFVKVATDKRPQIKVEYDNTGVKKPVETEELILDEFVEVMGVKAKGKKLSSHPVKEITWLDPIPVEEEEETEEEESEIEEEINDENEVEMIDDPEGEIDEVDLPEVSENPEIVEINIKKTEEIQEQKEIKEIKEIKEQKESQKSIIPREPKVPKEPKQLKEPKEPKEPKPAKEPKEIKKPLPPVKPPDFPEDDEDSGIGVQMTLF